MASARDWVFINQNEESLLDDARVAQLGVRTAGDDSALLEHGSAERIARDQGLAGAGGVVAGLVDDAAGLRASTGG